MIQICPSCGGNKMRFLGNNIYECEYCKQQFQEIQGPPPPPQNQQQLTVQQQQNTCQQPQQFGSQRPSATQQFENSQSNSILTNGIQQDTECDTNAEEQYNDEIKPLSERPLALLCVILGWGCIIFGVIDFCGMFGHYDLTGVFWSPIAAGLIGEFFKDYLANKC